MARTSAPRRSISKLNQPSHAPMSSTRLPVRSCGIGNCAMRIFWEANSETPCIREPSGSSKECHHPPRRSWLRHSRTYSSGSASRNVMNRTRPPTTANHHSISVCSGDEYEAMEPERSETLVELQVTEPSVLAVGVDLLHHGEPLGVAQVGAEGKFPVPAVIDAGIVEISQGPPAGGCAPGIPEGPGLEGAAARVPKIIRVTEAQRVELARYRDLGMRAQQQDGEPVLGVHHVEERESGVRAGCGQQLKERPVPFFMGIAAPRPIGKPAAQPGPDRRKSQ